MGWFSRKEADAPSQRRGNSSRQDDDDTHTLRQRARHRLIGASALVLAAIIVVPMLIGTDPQSTSSVPDVVQAPIPPIAQPIAPETSGQVAALPPDTSPLPVPDPVPVDPPAPVAPPAAPVTSAPEPPPVSVKPAPAPAPPPVADPPSKPAPPPSPPAATQRTDDGAVALALLEGRSPAGTASPAPAAAAKGNFVLQIVALSNDSEAQTRRKQLVDAGVTNAYVEQATSGGKTTYRLRVGPFSTREAAQAAQTRLRTLGYDNSFISSQ